MKRVSILAFSAIVTLSSQGCQKTGDSKAAAVDVKYDKGSKAEYSIEIMKVGSEKSDLACLVETRFDSDRGPSVVHENPTTMANVEAYIQNEIKENFANSINPVEITRDLSSAAIGLLFSFSLGTSWEVNKKVTLENLSIGKLNNAKQAANVLSTKNLEGDATKGEILSGAAKVVRGAFINTAIKQKQEFEKNCEEELVLALAKIAPVSGK